MRLSQVIKHHAFWQTPEFVFVSFCPRTSKVLKIKVRAKPKVMENLKRSWKVMEFEKLKRVQTLSYSPLTIEFLFHSHLHVLSIPFHLYTPPTPSPFTLLSTQCFVHFHSFLMLPTDPTQHTPITFHSTFLFLFHLLQIRPS